MKDVEGSGLMALLEEKSWKKRRRTTKNQVEKAPDSSAVHTITPGRKEKVFENRGVTSGDEDCIMMVCEARDSNTEKCLPENSVAKVETFSKNKDLETGVTGGSGRKSLTFVENQNLETEKSGEFGVECEENEGVFVRDYSIKYNRRKGRKAANIIDNGEDEQAKCSSDKPGKGASEKCGGNGGKVNWRENKDATQQKEDGIGGQRERRERPTKVLAKQPKASVAGMDHGRAGRGADAISMKKAIKVQIGKDYFKGVRKPINITLHKEVESYIRNRPQVFIKQLGKHSSETNINLNNETPTQDYMNKEVEMVNHEKMSNMDGEEDLCPAMIVHDLRISPIETRDNQNDVEKNLSLPFVKRSPMWEILESMEVYQKMPQKPHFSPLIETREVTREGSAIGLMTTFASLVEKTNGLKFEDPMSSFHNILNVLHDLEMHGFNAKAVQERLTKLLSIKVSEGKLQDQSKEVESEIMDCCTAKSNIEIEIDEIDKKMRELQERRALLESRKEGEDNEFFMLRTNVIVIIEDIKRTQKDFEKLVAAPF